MPRWLRYAVGKEHHFLNVPVAQRKGVIQPNAVANNFTREAMTGVHGQAVVLKVELVRLFSVPVNLTIPGGEQISETR